MRKILFLLFGIVFTTKVFAYDFKSGDLYYNIISNQEYYLVEVTYEERGTTGSGVNYSTLTSVTIPEEVTYDGQTYSVTGIGDYAFFDCSKLKSVVIPATVVSIGDDAFSDCISINSIVVPNSVSFIGSGAFTLVKNIVYHGTASSWGMKIWGALTLNGIIDGDFIFSDVDKNNLTAYIGKGGDVAIPNTVDSIGENAFANCDSLLSVIIPESVSYIGHQSFEDCINLSNVSMGNMVKEIGISAFAWCYKLKSLSIPNSVTSIGRQAFYGVGNVIYTGSATYDEGMTYSDDVNWGALALNGTFDGDLLYADAKKTYLIKYYGKGGNVVIPNSVKTIGTGAFCECIDTLLVTLGDSVTEIGDYAFMGCKLTTLSIPNSIMRIGTLAFYTDMEYNEFDSAYYLGNAENPYLCLIKPIKDSITSCIINDKCKVIASYAFSTADLKSIIIPNSVVSIGEAAFWGLFNNLKTVVIPNSVTEIGKMAFYGVLDIEYNGMATYDPKDVYWGAKMLNGAFDDNFIYTDKEKSNISEYIGNGGDVIIPESVISIGNDVFMGREDITSVIISNSVKNIGRRAFYDCRGMKSVEFGNSVSEIGDLSFFYCECLSSIALPESVTKIGEAAFKACNGLTSVNIPDSAKEIGEEAFSSCDSLKTLVIPNSISSIGERAFKDVRHIEYYGTATYTIYDEYWGAWSMNGVVEDDLVYLDEGKTTIVKYIGNGGEVVIPETVTEISDKAFYYSKITSVTIPESVIKMGECVFACCYYATIYCQRASEPQDWGEYWNDVCPVVWLGTPPNSDGIEEELVDANIYALNNTIVVENANSPIRVFDAVGRCIVCKEACGYITIGVERAGLYVVKTGTQAQRVVVR